MKTNMNEFVTINFLNDNLRNILSKEELYEILDESEIEFLDTYYNDLEVNLEIHHNDFEVTYNGFSLVNGYMRKNQELSKWRSILCKIANIEDKPMEILFFFDDFLENFGYRAYPNSTIKRLALEWNEMEEYVMLLDDIKDNIDQLIKLEQESTFEISHLEKWIRYLEQELQKDKLKYFECPCNLCAIKPYMQECPIEHKIHIAYKYSDNEDYEEFTEIENVCENICDRTELFKLIQSFVISEDISKEHRKEAVDYLIKKITQLLNTIKNENLIPMGQ